MKTLRRIALAQIDPCVGDMDGNAALMLECIGKARDEHGADAVIFPELAVCGYPPEDLLLRPDFYPQAERARRRIVAAADGVSVIFGYPEQDGERRYNACGLACERRLAAVYHKRNLPNYGVFDEKRYFTEGEAAGLVEAPGLRLALSVCEDLWAESHARQVAAGAQLLININASPYHTGKAAAREKLLRRRALDHGVAIIYVNLVGGQDELVFDGGSLVVDGRGEFVFKAPQFETGLYLVELDMKAGERLGLVARSAQAPPLSPEAGVYGALTLGVRDYVKKNGFKGAVIGLSGGIDSALTLALAVDALGADNVTALSMPSRYTAAMSVEDAQRMAKNLGVECHVLGIEPPFAAFLEILAPLFLDLPADAAEENIQARCRGVLLMALSNKTGRLVLTTGNKSETAVGYATLYGDMAGGFAPLKDVPKTLVFQLCRWRNRNGEIIPQRIIERPPSAELRPDQKDEDSLPPYEALDPILEQYIEQDRSPAAIIAAGFDEDAVRRAATLVDKNEYKRRQAAPGVRITERAFGRDRRYPITSRYRET